MLTYTQLFGWRNLCEFLEEQHYNFADCWEIKKKCKCLLPNLYNPHDKRFRFWLWDKYLIQFISWGQHPILYYKTARSVRKQYKDEYGWRLVSDWELKIDFLEKIVLFGVEPEHRPWEAAVRQRMEHRRQIATINERNTALKQMSKKDRQVECSKLGICYNCFSPIPFLMIDCPNCGAIQP